MASYSRNEVILVRYPFTDLSGSKVRPAVVVNPPHPSADCLVVPLTSRTMALQPGEFLLQDWSAAGLNVASAVKRGVSTVHERHVAKLVGRLSPADAARLEQSLRAWLGL
jgi:mRNA-degrading endonuclease toxin of MazEF toxin-antitoxin module